MNSFAFRISMFLLFPIAALGQEGLTLSGNLKFGAYPVGYRQQLLRDSTAVDQTNLQTFVWYPAKDSNKQSIRFKDYLEANGALPLDELHSTISQMIGGKEKLFTADTLNLLANARMKAVLNAEEKNEKFPLLLWSSRYGTVEYQSIFSEFLASNGYVVVYVEDRPNSPLPWQLQSKDEKRNVLDGHLADLRYAIEMFRDFKNIDVSKTAVLSWSYGGESAILTQLRIPEVDCVVGLSAIGFSYGVYLGEELKQTLDLEKMNVPYLILSEKVAPNGKNREVPIKFKSLHEHSRHIFFNQLAHGNFNVVEGMLPGIIDTKKVQSWSKGGRLAKLGFENICKITLSYLDAILKSGAIAQFDDEARDLMQKLPQDFISITSGD